MSQTKLTSLFSETAFGNCKYRIKDPNYKIICTNMKWPCEGPHEEWGCGLWKPRDKRKGPFYWHTTPDKGHYYPKNVKDLSLYV